MILLKLRMGADNISYVVASGADHSCAVIDPIVTDEIIEAIEKAGLGEVELIVNTHGHPDHTSGNVSLAESTGARIVAHDPDRAHIPGNPEPVKDGDIINLDGMDIKIIHTPGHTAGGICLRIKPGSGPAHLISGDTVFLAGCGNARFGGDPEVLYESFRSKIFTLPGDTILHPGHNYAANNLLFALSLYPDNPEAEKKLDEVKKKNKTGEIPGSTLAEEKNYNPFFMLDSDKIRNILQKKTGREYNDDKSVFLALRDLRNRW